MTPSTKVSISLRPLPVVECTPCIDSLTAMALPTIIIVERATNKQTWLSAAVAGISRRGLGLGHPHVLAARLAGQRRRD